MPTTFLEPGGDSTFNVATTTSGGFWNTASGLLATDFVHGNHQNSLKFPKNSGDVVISPTGILSDSGSRVSLYVYLTGYPTGSTSPIFNDGNAVWAILVTSTGVLQLWQGGLGAQIGTNGPTLKTGQWYRISIAYTITSSSVNRFEIFVNGVSAISVTNGTLAATGTSSLQIGNSQFDGTLDTRISDIYVDSSNSLADTGDIWVIAKRPNANGTTNGFTTQIGSGGSGYGTGHSPQVNERPLSTTNGWSIIGAGSAVTEEYNIEGKSVGDFDLTNFKLVDFMGWVYASAALSETGQIIVAGVNTNISLTSTNTMFTKAAGSTTYPAGGTDIGIVTSTTVTTVSLYECGIIAAFIMPKQNTSSAFFDFMGPAEGYNNA